MKIHEFAEIFPDMNSEQFAELKEDIKKNGQISPIITFKGAVIDGKNRLKACQELNKEPYTDEYKGDPENLIPFVISQNLQRRHLDSSQRAVASLKCADLLEAEAKKRQGKRTDLKPEETPLVKGSSAEQAAKMFGTNKEYVKGAKKIKEKAPDLLKKVVSGEKTIKQALKEVKEQEETEVAANRNGYETRKRFWRLYSIKYLNRANKIVSSERMEQHLASILNSHKKHRENTETILHKFQENGHQPNIDYQDTINKCKELISFLNNIALTYEAADETVKFYSDNRDILNKEFEKEANEFANIQPLWEIVYTHYQEKDKTYKKQLRLEPDKVLPYMKENVPTKRCGKAVATLLDGSPLPLSSFHKYYVGELEEFKSDPIELLPPKGLQCLKKQENKTPNPAFDSFMKQS